MPNYKDKLRTYIRNCNEGSRKKIEKLGEQMKDEQNVNDLTGALELLINNLKPSGVTKGMLEPWRNLSDNYSKASYSLFEDVGIAGVSTATFSTMKFAYPSYLKENSISGKEKEAINASIHLKNVIEKLAKKEKVLMLFKEFGFSKASLGKQSPVTLFETACLAFEAPVKDIPISSMIPMRECVNSTIEALMKRRKKQERCKPKYVKVVSIISQANRNQISMETIKSIAAQWDELNGKLSGGKQGVYNRDEVRSILNESILFLIGFLESLDQSKMKNIAS